MMNELTVKEMEKVAGGTTESTTVDPETGDTVVRDCTGGEIRRYDSMGNMVIRVADVSIRL